MPDWPKMQPIPGIRTKFRTSDGWVTATVWRDGEPAIDVARLNLDLLDRPGSPAYQAWVDAVSTVVHDFLSRVSGVPGIAGKRKAPDYTGEE